MTTPVTPGIPVAPDTRDPVRAAVLATFLAFGGCGFAFASWASRIPQVRDHLGLSPARLGVVLLAIAAGSLVALPLAGTVVSRLGPRRTVGSMAVLLAVALATVSLGYPVGLPPVVVGLFLLGFANGAWDVAMNVHGAVVERLLGRSIMSRFHAGYSLGTVAGALLGAAMVALHVPVTAHLLGVAVVVAVVVPWGTRTFLAADAADADADAGADVRPDVKADPAAAPRSALAGWREPRTLLIGVFVLAFAFAEGTGNDWVSLATIDGYDTSAAIGTLAFALFLCAMTVGRWFGPTLLDRHGRVPVLRALAVLGIAGALLFVFAPVAPLAFLGVVLWGAGVSLGFPVGMSAGADEPQHAAGRVSVIASVGYCAFLAGPPAVGLLADHLTVLRAMVAVPALLAVASLLTPVVRAPEPAPAEAAPVSAEAAGVNG